MLAGRRGSLLAARGLRENVAGLRSIDGIRSVTVQPIGHVIANVEGKKASVAIYNHLAVKYGNALTLPAAKEGLALYDEVVEDARQHPGSHPNIDLLLQIVAQDTLEYSLQVETDGTSGAAFEASGDDEPEDEPERVPGSGSRHPLGELKTALRCQATYAREFDSDPEALREALGDACAEGEGFNPLQCCRDAAEFLSSGPLKGCVCNQRVYDELCGQLTIGPTNCGNLFSTLRGCGLEC